MRLLPLMITATLLGACAALPSPSGTGPRPAGVTLQGRVKLGTPQYGLLVPASPLMAVPAYQVDRIATVEIWLQERTTPFPSDDPLAQCLGPNGLIPTSVPTAIYTWLPTNQPTTDGAVPTTVPTVLPTWLITSLPTTVPTVHPVPSQTPPPDAVRVHAFPAAAAYPFTIPNLPLDRYFRLTTRAFDAANVQISCADLSKRYVDTRAGAAGYPSTLSVEVPLALLREPTYLGAATLGFNVLPGGIASPSAPPVVAAVSARCTNPVTPVRGNSGPLVDPVLMPQGGTWFITSRSEAPTGCLNGTRCAYFDGKMAVLDVVECPM